MGLRANGVAPTAHIQYIYLCHRMNIKKSFHSQGLQITIIQWAQID
jgi:hypothetical protein